MKLLIVADAHANWPALLAVAEQELDADAVVSLGDLVINGPLPAEVVEWTRRRATWSVIGNHDQKVLAALDGAGDDRVTRARVLAVQHARCLSRKQLRYLRALPDLVRFEFGGAAFTAVHGSVTSRTTGSLKPETGPLVIRSELDQARTDYLLAGHTHLPVVRTYAGRTLLNPGAVGQPRDGDPRAQYAVWEDGRIELRRAAYDIEETVAAMLASDCPPEYLPALIRGWREGINPSAIEPD